MLDDILVNSMFPGEEITRYTKLNQGNVNVMILLIFLCSDVPLEYN